MLFTYVTKLDTLFVHETPLRTSYVFFVRKFHFEFTKKKIYLVLYEKNNKIVPTTKHEEIYSDLSDRIAQFRYIKIQSETINITSRLRGINPDIKSTIYFPEPRSDVNCLRLNFNISTIGLLFCMSLGANKKKFSS